MRSNISTLYLFFITDFSIKTVQKQRSENLKQVFKNTTKINIGIKLTGKIHVNCFIIINNYFFIVNKQAQVRKMSSEIGSANLAFTDSSEPISWNRLIKVFMLLQWLESSWYYSRAVLSISIFWLVSYSLWLLKIIRSTSDIWQRQTHCLLNINKLKTYFSPMEVAA